MTHVLAKAIPFDKNFITLALESGVDALIVEPDDKAKVEALAKVTVYTPKDFCSIQITDKKDEKQAVKELQNGCKVILTPGWEVIPVENILAQATGLGLHIRSIDEALLASGIMERGVDFIVLEAETAPVLKTIVKELKLDKGTTHLETAKITAIENAGLGHRVCIDTTSRLRTGQGMLVGNSSAFSFLVHAETEANPYVAARPFRVNAGALHAYTHVGDDKTSYLDELEAGSNVLVVDNKGQTSLATVGRVKTEVRPLLLITATTGAGKTGSLFLQNAETIRLVTPEGAPVSVVALKKEDQILVHTDQAGRHFGMRITEDITEE